MGKTINIDDKNKIKFIYSEMERLFRKRDDIKNIIAKTRAELTKLVNPYYWDMSYKLADLENILEIPCGIIHLYATPKKINVKCVECGKIFKAIISSRMDLEKDRTCNNDCYFARMQRFDGKYSEE